MTEPCQILYALSVTQDRPAGGVEHGALMKPALLFDLGNTLAAYYHSEQFQPILERGIAAVSSELESRGLSHVTFDAAFASAIAENREAPDFRFTPMAERFERIFDIDLSEDSPLAQLLCELFLAPIFEIGRVYDDARPVIGQLREAGFPLAIVSNAPWGSPPDLWRNELERLGLASAVDAIVMCGDIGWRKPARAIFEFAASALDRSPDQCIFVGDDLRWDVSGSKAVGMRSVLIDRDHRHKKYVGDRIEGLHELLAIVA
jgi:putative hydrolase of the HAD superfamily